MIAKDQRKRSYILWGAAIGFAVPLIPVLLLAILQFEALMLASIVVFSLGPAAIASISSFIAATTLMGGLIGYWVWKAKVKSEESPRGQRHKVEEALSKAKKKLEGS